MSSESDGRGESELKEQFRRLQVIYRMTVALSQADDLDQICNQALRGLEEALAGSRAGLLIRDREAGTGLQLYAWKGQRERWKALAECILSLISSENADAFFVADVDTNAQIGPYRSVIRSQGIRAFAFIPLHYQQQLLGGLILRYDDTHSFSDEEITVSGALAGHMALALARKQNEQLLKAARDEMEQRIERRTTQLKDEVLQRKRAEERLRNESARVRLLQEIAAFANEADNFNDALHFTLNKVCEFASWPLGHVYTISRVDGERLASGRLWYCDDVDRYHHFRQEREALSIDPIEGWLGDVQGSDDPDWLTTVTEKGVSHIDPAHESGIVSSFAFPVVVNAEVVAILEFFSTGPIEPESNLIAAMQFVATQLAHVVEREHAKRQLERRAQQFAALHDVAQTVASSLDLDTILERVLDTLRPLLDAEGVFILLYDGDEHLVFAAANEVGVGNLAGKRVLASKGVAGEVLRTGQVQWVYGDETAERVYHELEQVAHYHPRAIMAAPLKLRDELIGVIEAVHTDSGAFGKEDIRIMETAANWAAITIGNARLFQAQQEARRMAETLRAANSTLSQTLDLQTILDTLFNYASELIGFERALILLLHRDGRLRVRSSRGFDHVTLGIATYNVADLPEFERLLQEKASVILEGAGSHRPDTDWRPKPGEMALAVPLLSGDRVVGILTLYNDNNAYTDRHATLAEALAAQASVAIQNARLFAQVQAGRERLRHLGKQVVSAQEEERQRVSRELHDEAGQALTALKISLEMIKVNWNHQMPQSVYRQLDEAIAMTDQTMEQIRLLAHDLRPPVLDTFGLGASLEGIVRDFGRRTDLEIEFKGAQLSNLPETATIAFYRFVQEALTNIARHADATKVQVELRDDSDKIMVAVTDNGSGFRVEEKVNVEGPRGGIGLAGMQDRFDLLNGWVEIESAPGQGTRVAAYVPRQEER
ncbi:MAG TPA: GAF domain-containing protein [Candidatus Sulfomarinibacteraceae bacterium]|nr:GAF domain-containing protein [Candidatus Sulfomarinibacteraceae bacterium]